MLLICCVIAGFPQLLEQIIVFRNWPGFRTKTTGSETAVQKLLGFKTIGFRNRFCRVQICWGSEACFLFLLFPGTEAIFVGFRHYCLVGGGRGLVIMIIMMRRRRRRRWWWWFFLILQINTLKIPNLWFFQTL